MDKKQSIAVVGGGITGIAAALELAKTGQFEVTLFEQADHLGGMSDYFTWKGITWDRFYHVILSTDAVMLDFIKEIGLEDQLFWKETKTGFYGDGKLVSMSTTIDFIRFPFLSLWQKFRLGVGILYSSRITETQKLERIYVRQWLTKVFGRRVYEKIWDPLLRSKLGDAREKTSAAFIWATINRLYGARNAENKKEKMGHVHGGYKTILDAAEKNLKQLGVKILLNSPITKIKAAPERDEISLPKARRLKPGADSASVLNLQTAELHSPKQTNSTNETNQTNKTNKTKKSLRLVANDQEFFFNKILLTINCPTVLKIIDHRTDNPYWHKLTKIQFLGVICCLLILKRKLSPYYVINLLDKELPFTGIIEATNIISPGDFFNKHIVYLPKYVTENDPMNKLNDQEIAELFIDNLRKVFPDLLNEEILHYKIFREKYVQPLQDLNCIERKIGSDTPIEDLYMANTSMIYNTTLNNNAVLKIAIEVSNKILNNFSEGRDVSRIPDPQGNDSDNR